MIRWSADADDCILMIKRDKTHVRRDPSIVSSNLTNPTFHKVTATAQRIVSAPGMSLRLWAYDYAFLLPRHIYKQVGYLICI